MEPTNHRKIAKGDNAPEKRKMVIGGALLIAGIGIVASVIGYTIGYKLGYEYGIIKGKKIFGIKMQ